MIQRFTGQLPIWARTEHPLLRYELARVAGRLPRRTQYLRALWIVLFGFVLVGGGYLIATGFLREPPGQNPTESALNIVFWPMLVIQMLLSVVAMAITGGTVAEEVRRQRWDNLRATEVGAEMTVRTRWAAVFYRIRGLLAVVLLVRAGLIVGIALQLSQGSFLQGWTSLKVVSVLGLWIVFAILLYMRYGAHVRGRQAALWTCIAFGLLLVVLIAPVHPFVPGGR